MAVIVERRFGPLDQIELTNRQVMREVGLLARERILRRTAQGLDATGQPFRPYSPAYARRKGTTRVDLKLSGAMLNAITLGDVTDDSVELVFSS